MKKIVSLLLIATACMQAQASPLRQLTARLVTTGIHQTKRITVTTAHKVISPNYAKNTHTFWKDIEQSQKRHSNLSLGMYVGVPITSIVGLLGHFC